MGLNMMDWFSSYEVIGIIIFIIVSVVFSEFKEFKTKDFKSPPASDDKPYKPDDENDKLPKTGHKDVRRLLACKGKDCYSILGLQSDASDKTIKMFYRKQALLVHPDKNKECGAEEAFKILDAAFRTLSDPIKKRMYDIELKQTKEEEAARRHREEQAKAEMACKLIQCNNCGRTHKQILTKRSYKSSRYCQKQMK